MNSKGTILAQVLLMGMLLMFLTALLIRAVFHQYQFGALAIGSARETKNAEASISAANSAWNINNGQDCSSYTWNAGAGVQSRVCCDGGCANSRQGTCSCTCTVQIGGQSYPSVTASTAGGNCQVQAVSADYP